MEEEKRSFPEGLTAEDCAAYRRDGYLVLRNVLDAESCEQGRRAADVLSSHAARNAKDLFSNYYLQHRVDRGVLYDLYQRHPFFHTLARHPRIVAGLRPLLGPNFFLYENSLVFKPRGAENEVPWHQDFMNRPDEPAKVIVWIALDDVDEENGSLYVLPGSHDRGYLPWFKVRGEAYHTRARLDGLDESKATPVCLRAGDVLFFACTLLHSSRRTASSRPRRAFRAAYQDFSGTWTPRATPLVISMENPEALAQVHDYEPTLLQRLAHKLGTRLTRL